MARQPNRGDIVRVTGTVRLEPLKDLERELAIDVRAGVETLATAKGLVLVADRIVPAP